jgi:C4-dicarboxylate-specific signal transduction histidine kinase
VDRETGELDWDLTTKVPLRDSHGTVIGLVSIGRTITERKRAEEALAERTRQLEAVRAVTAEITRELDLHTLLGLIARHTRDLVQAPSVTLNLWDDEAQVLIPQTWLGFDAWRGEVRLRLGEGVAGAVAERRAGLIVNDFRTSPYALPIFLERSTYTAVLAEPLLYRSRLIGVLAVARERTGLPFTEKDRELLALFATQAAIAIENAQLYRQVQDHAEILERRVEERTQALKEAQAELVQSAKLAAVGMLAAGVAHELNQPLTIIRGYAQHLVGEGRLPEEAKAALDHIQAQSERMATIVNHLRDFSRQTKGTYEAVALNEVVAAAFLMLRQQLRVRKIEVVQALEPALPAIWGDRFQLEQVFINLITNARDAVEPQGGGRLTVTSRAVGDWVEVAVADTGPGVPVDLQDRIFEPFFTTKDVGDGTGLGLSISYGIIREHGGEIRVANRPEGGAEFVVRLPVHSPAQSSGNSTDAQKGR